MEARRDPKRELTRKQHLILSGSHCPFSFSYFYIKIKLLEIPLHIILRHPFLTVDEAARGRTWRHIRNKREPLSPVRISYSGAPHFSAKHSSLSPIFSLILPLSHSRASFTSSIHTHSHHLPF